MRGIFLNKKTVTNHGFLKNTGSFYISGSGIAIPENTSANNRTVKQRKTTIPTGATTKKITEATPIAPKSNPIIFWVFEILDLVPLNCISRKPKAAKIPPKIANNSRLRVCPGCVDE